MWVILIMLIYSIKVTQGSVYNALQYTLKSKRKNVYCRSIKDKSQTGVNVNTVNVACILLQAICTWDFLIYIYI